MDAPAPAPVPQIHEDGEDPTHGVIFARLLDGHGGARKIDWEEARNWRRAAGSAETLWLHLDRRVPAVGAWLHEGLALSDATADVLVSHETRPRAFREDDTLVAILRGINLNAGQDMEDMIALQIWGDGERVVTLRRRRLQTPRDVLTTLEDGIGPCNAGDLFVELIDQLVTKINLSIIATNEEIDALEANAYGGNSAQILDHIGHIRRDCLRLKRYMSPQHEALVQIGRDAPDWISARNRTDIRETIDRLHRYLEDIDVSKESVIVLQDELDSRAAARSGHTMYMLSIVAAIFLPLSFVTGLLGINVGGMPGVQSGDAFWITVGALVVLLVIQIWLFRKWKWL